MKLAVVLACAFLAMSAMAVDPAEVEKLLETTGAEGWLHASVPEQGIWAFTYRNPKNFFDYLIMSLSNTTATQLMPYKRHDKIRVKGNFIKNPSGQKHIHVGDIEMVTQYQPPMPVPPYHREVHIPGDLKNRTEETFLVHAMLQAGGVFVVEYHDAVLPVYVTSQYQPLVKGLWRNDVIRMKYKLIVKAGRPVHLLLDGAQPNPLVVVDAVTSRHQQPVSITGALILFPKSPEISLNVFAVQELLPLGGNRQFTLVNFDDEELFFKLIAKLQMAWDAHPAAYINGRNKFVNTEIKVRATGTFSVTDPSQANAQILINKLEDVEIIV